MATARRSGRSRFTLILLVLTSVTLLTLDYRGFEPLESAREGALGALAPVRDAAGTVVSPFSEAWNGAFGYGDLEAENERLRDRIAELESQAASVERDRETLRQLLAELEIPYVEDLPTAVAEVAASPVGNFDHTIQIDKGRADGIQTGMPVLNHRSLVGVVSLVSDRRATVQLITDPDFKVGVRLAGSQTVGVARGQGQGRDLVIFQGINADVTVEEGELVTTSGLERGRFPGGIPIGFVGSAIQLEGELTQDVFVELLADLDALNFVTVVLWEPEP